MARQAIDYQAYATALDVALPAGWQRGPDTVRGYPSAYIVLGGYGERRQAEVFLTDYRDLAGWVWAVWRQIWTPVGMPYPGMEPHRFGLRKTAIEAVAAACAALDDAADYLTRQQRQKVML